MIFELLMEKLMAQGMSEEDAFTETLSIDCNMDEEDDDKEYVENSGGIAEFDFELFEI